MTEVKPNFLIIGAAKAGTTSLYYYLKQHNDIGFPSLKEPKYFSSSCIDFPQKGPGDWSYDNYHIKDESKYFNLFENLKDFKKTGEASPDYLFYHEHTAKKIINTLGDIPIIILLRNPIDRAYSAYSHLVRDGRELISFREALSLENERTVNRWDFMWRYKKASMYYSQVKTFLNTFSNVKIVIFEEFITDPLFFTNDILQFLKLDRLKSIKILNHNPSGIPTNFISKFILNRNSKLSVQIREFLKRNISRGLLETIAKKSLKKNKIKIEDREFLANIFKEDVQYLESLLGQDLKIWKK